MRDEEFGSIARVHRWRWLAWRRWQHEYGRLWAASTFCPPGGRSAVQIVDLYGRRRVRRWPDFPEDEDRGPPCRHRRRRRLLLGNTGDTHGKIVCRNPDGCVSCQLYRATSESAEVGNRNRSERRRSGAIGGRWRQRAGNWEWGWHSHRCYSALRSEGRKSSLWRGRRGSIGGL